MPKKSLDKEKVQTDLLTYLRRHGATASRFLCQILQISQPTLSRLLAAFKDRIVVIGKAKETQYALSRHIDGIVMPLPIYEIREDGSSRRFGMLHAIQPQGYYFESHLPDMTSSLYPDLPYFLNDMRPSGYLGRLTPAQNLDLELPADILSWTAEHCLKFLSQREWNSIGNLIVGEKAFQLYLKNCQFPQHAMHATQRAKLYPRFADDTLHLGDPGSSAGGEHAKFTTTLLPKQEPVLVKFSPPLNTAVGKRIADLMVCEHLAHRVIAEHSHAAAESTLATYDDRVFLEIKRFDRTHAFGRRGLISLGSLDAEFTGVSAGWSKTTAALIKTTRLPSSMQEKVRWLELFGQLIANNDMHLYNLSFLTRGNNVIDLAPVYDMLPMLFMPRSHQIISVEFTPPLPLPDDSHLWHSVYEAACDFWEAVATDKRVSPAFKKIALDCKNKVMQLEKLFYLLPK